MNNKIDQRATVLVVDDNPTNLDVLYIYLDRSGFEVLIAEDGASAIEQTKHILPDIILLDVMMPGIDGFETCRRLKEDVKTKDIPVIFMTALSDVEDKVKGFEVGGVDYVTKPFQHEEIIARLTNHLSLQKLQKSLREQNQELTAFSQTVSRDLKIPLTTVISLAEIMRDSRILPEKLHEHIDAILQTVFRMQNITDELLLLADLRGVQPELKPLDMTMVVRRAKDRLTYVISGYQANLTEPREWPIALGLDGWVEQVWINYINQTIKHGKRPPRVELGFTPQDNGFIRFWARDNGPGLKPEDNANVATEFFEQKQFETKGYGLGLIVVKRIVDKLGGQVGVESEVGKGNTFYFTLKKGN